MSTPISEINDIFLKQIGKDIMLEYQDEIIEDLLLTYLQGAIADFHECKKDLTIIEIEEDGIFMAVKDDLSMEEKFILSRGMILYWLQPKILTQDILKNRITDGDYSIKSPANLLNNLLKLKDSSEADMYKRRVRYSYKGKDINE
jgi:hypothetical protein